jgi:hypothetical protein
MKMKIASNSVSFSTQVYSFSCAVLYPVVHELLCGEEGLGNSWRRREDMEGRV